MDISTQAKAVSTALAREDVLKVLESVGVGRLLRAVGLGRRPARTGRVWPPVVLALVSAAAGAGVALLLTPSSGAHFRSQLLKVKHRLDDSIAYYERSTHALPRARFTNRALS